MKAPEMKAPRTGGRGNPGQGQETPWRALAGLARWGLLLAVLGLGGVMIGTILFAAGLDRREPVELKPADGIVVLTGGADRIQDALGLMDRRLGHRLFISGVNTQTRTETLRRQWPGREAMFSCCVDLDFRARNTFGNAIETREWAQRHGFGSLILVTASYHVPRAQAEFAAAMPSLALQIYPVVPEASRINRWWQEPTLTRILMLEFVKYSAARLRIAMGLPGRT